MKFVNNNNNNKKLKYSQSQYPKQGGNGSHFPRRWLDPVRDGTNTLIFSERVADLSLVHKTLGLLGIVPNFMRQIDG